MVNEKPDLPENLEMTEEVRRARENDDPVLALESTLIAHGFPYPQNYELALEIEEYARNEDVVPATIAILDGTVKVGLTEEEIEYIASANDIQKVSLRDVPPVVGKGLDGATTVAGTVQVADLVGISFFVTGGIGGVHPNCSERMDISADIQALSRYGVTVISAGAKSVLDLPKTRERLESLGVPVLGYGCDNFPAFYVRDSGLPVDYRVDTPEEVVNIIRAGRELGTQAGSLVATPIPKEDELDPEEHERLMNSLVKEARKRGITGKEITPFLLRRLKEETGGESLEANISLIKNNLVLGCLLARRYSESRSD